MRGMQNRYENQNNWKSRNCGIPLNAKNRIFMNDFQFRVDSNSENNIIKPIYTRGVFIVRGHNGKVIIIFYNSAISAEPCWWSWNIYMYFNTWGKPAIYIKQKSYLKRNTIYLYNRRIFDWFGLVFRNIPQSDVKYSTENLEWKLKKDRLKTIFFAKWVVRDSNLRPEDYLPH